MLFARQPTKAELQGHRVVKVGAFTFTIRRLSPLLDFEPDRMPQIFSAGVSRRKVREDKPKAEAEVERILEDMAVVIEAGVVDPVVVPVGKGEKKGREDGITVDDLMRYDDVAGKLYTEIIAWSMTKYRGWRGAVEVSRNKAIMLDAIAKRYGQRPSDIALPDGSDAEKQMLDAFVAGQGAQAESDAHKEAMARVKRG